MTATLAKDWLLTVLPDSTVWVQGMTRHPWSGVPGGIEGTRRFSGCFGEELCPQAVSLSGDPSLWKRIGGNWVVVALKGCLLAFQCHHTNPFAFLNCPVFVAREYPLDTSPGHGLFYSMGQTRQETVDLEQWSTSSSQDNLPKGQTVVFCDCPLLHKSLLLETYFSLVLSFEAKSLGMFICCT